MAKIVRWVISKILRLDKNNQYGFVMTKPFYWETKLCTKLEKMLQC